ncbi:MAG: hypothetical protein LBJ12_02890 [Oscillospiraceae bacterium]|jgi:hypothetical protein|nr:hypothetical protein [Oscillospiraceae bacterium]
MQQIDPILNREGTFNRVLEKYQHIQRTPGAQFFYDSGYERLFHITDETLGLQSAALLLGIMILSFCGLFSVEYKSEMYKVLSASRKGRWNTIKTKLCIASVLTVVYCLVSYLPDLFAVQHSYGLDCLGLGLRSMPALHCWGSLPIWVYIVLLLVIRIFICLCVMLMIAALSLRTKHNIFTALAYLTDILRTLPVHPANPNRPFS